jgi:NAD(P)-dependent dehydrogenase (short-subunit alcohol dehydrogenase family)
MPVAVVVNSDVGVGPAICERLRATGHEVRTIHAGESSRVSIGAAVAERCAGGVDVLVNNLAPIESGGVLEDGSKFWASLDSGLNGTFSACREAARIAVERGASLSIVNLVSATAAVGVTGRGAEGCVSAGIVAASKALAAEWGPVGVRVNVVMVGPTEAWLPPDGSAGDIPGVIPLGRLVTDTDVAVAVAAIAEPEAITGEVLTVDAGWLAHGWRRE